MTTYKDIEQASSTIRTTNIKGKEYAEVNQRVKAFRMVYPTGFITSEMLSDQDGVCVFKAYAGVTAEDGRQIILGTGHAYEREDSSYINKTSYIENCETSAIGRALGMCGFGIDTAVCSAEELTNAINNQSRPDNGRKASPKQIEVLANAYKGDNLRKLLEVNGLNSLDEMPMAKASELISKLKGAK